MTYDTDKFRELIERAKGIKFGSQKKHPLLMPTVFNKNTNENFISDWLAFVLDPSVNSIGIAPLNFLLEAAGYEHVFSEYADTDMGDAGSYGSCREVVLSGEDRIDLLFSVFDKGKTYLVAIENKIYAPQSKDGQLLSYGKSIRKKYQNIDGFFLIYLTRRPSEAETKGTGFRSATHGDFVNKLRTVPLDFISHLRESFLIREYIINMEEYIMTGSITQEEISFFCRSENFRLAEAMEESRQSFICLVRETVDRAVGELFSSLGYEHGGPDNCSVQNFYSLWYKKDWPLKDNVHFELVSPDKSGFIDENGTVNIRAELHVEFDKNDAVKSSAVKKSLGSSSKSGRTLVSKKSDISVASGGEDAIDLLARDLKEKMRELVDRYGETIARLDENGNLTDTEKKETESDGQL